jgi:hypothetical protein
LMMGGVSPKAFWASYKYGIIKFWYIVASCQIFLYEQSSLFVIYGLFEDAVNGAATNSKQQGVRFKLRTWRDFGGKRPWPN